MTKTNEDGPDWELLHKSNMDEIKERAKKCPYLFHALQMHLMGKVPWEYAITAVALSLSEDRVRLVNDLTKALERSTTPYTGAWYPKRDS